MAAGENMSVFRIILILIIKDIFFSLHAYISNKEYVAQTKCIFHGQIQYTAVVYSYFFLVVH